MLQYVTRKLECQSIEDSEDDDGTRNIKVSVNVQFDFILNYKTYIIQDYFMSEEIINCFYDYSMTGNPKLRMQL